MCDSSGIYMAVTTMILTSVTTTIVGIGRGGFQLNIDSKQSCSHAVTVNLIIPLLHLICTSVLACLRQWNPHPILIQA